MLEEHLGYLRDVKRLALYERALGQSVRAGDVALDLGCGTGVLGMMALRAGASFVHCIDSGPILRAAQQSFERADLADRASFLQSRSFAVELGEKADIGICDHVGYFGVDYGVIELLADARRRLLKPSA